MSHASVGRKLRQAREARLLNLEQIARATHMRLSYLQALETGELSALPSLAQARGFLRAYASYLHLDDEALLQELAAPDLPEAGLAPETSGTPEPEPPSADVSQAEEEADPAMAIFRQIGLQLHRQRDLLGLTFDDVERQTHLRSHYLRILEEGSLDELPSPVQGRGMLHVYASFLGMPVEPLMLQFAEGLQSRLAVRQRIQASARPAPTVPRRPAPDQGPNPVSPSPLRQLVMGENLLAVLMTLVVLVFVAWALLSILDTQSPGAVAPTAPSIADVLLATETPAATSPLDLASTTPEAAEAVLVTETPLVVDTSALPTAGATGVQIYLTVYQRAWMRITVDGKVEFEGRVLPGSAYTFAGGDQIEVLTGNAAALQVFFNGQDQGVLGRNGQVITQVYTPQGVIAPTPTPTIPPTQTPLPTATPQPSPTLAEPPFIGTQPALP